MKITFLGGGNMANALIGGMMKQGISAPTSRVIDPGSAARDKLAATFAVNCLRNGRNARQPPANCWCWRSSRNRCRKPLPRSPASSATPSSSASPPDCDLADLSRWLGGHRKVVRCMPNTPALIGAGITGLCALPESALTNAPPPTVS